MNKTKKLINQYKTTFFSFFILIPFEFWHVGFRSAGSMLLLLLLFSVDWSIVWFPLWSFRPVSVFGLMVVFFLRCHLCLSPQSLSVCNTSKIMSSVRLRARKGSLQCNRIGRSWSCQAKQVAVIVCSYMLLYAWMEVKLMFFCFSDACWKCMVAAVAYTVFRFYEMQNWINGAAAARLCGIELDRLVRRQVGR